MNNITHDHSRYVPGDPIPPIRHPGDPTEYPIEDVHRIGQESARRYAGTLRRLGDHDREQPGMVSLYKPHDVQGDESLGPTQCIHGERST